MIHITMSSYMIKADYPKLIMDDKSDSHESCCTNNCIILVIEQLIYLNTISSATYSLHVKFCLFIGRGVHISGRRERMW